MSTRALDRPAEVRKLALQQACLEGELTVAELPRFAQVLADTNGNIQYCLRFSMAENGMPLIEGTLAGRVNLFCQRCLEAMSWELANTLRLGVVWSDDEAARLPRQVDPVVGAEGCVNLLEILEDELLLSLPIVSYHQPGHCGADGHVHAGAGEGNEPPAETESREHPFQALAALKDKSS